MERRGTRFSPDRRIGRYMLTTNFFNLSSKWVHCTRFFINLTMEVDFINNKFKNQEEQVNEGIFAREMLVIGPDGHKYGILSKREALATANEVGLDLVVVSPDSSPVVAKLMDYSKYRFELQKKQKEIKKNQKVTVVKEVQLSFSIQEHDLNTKANQARKFLEKGNRIKVTLRLNGRLISKQDIAKTVMDSFVEKLSDIAQVESEVKLDGKNLITVLTQKKDK